VSAELHSGEVVELDSGIRRLLAPNASFMTGPGTNTYLLGKKEIAVLDPGPAIPAHIEHIIAAAAAPIRWILVTHTHPDHSPAARSLAEKTGAMLIGRPAPEGPQQDRSFKPQRILEDGEEFITAEFGLRAIHTPGHASNHLCYELIDRRWLFTGDHIMNGSTVVINPPDGNMIDYLASLRKVAALDLQILAPGHGELLEQPRRVAEWIINHRLEREAHVVEVLRAMGSASVTEMVTAVYADVDEFLHRVAQRSLLAHLIKLEADGRAQRSGDRWTMLEV
jgi:glyoxylase-like metal-dependent hydrolase (beta-lactamase superfamily II)